MKKFKNMTLRANESAMKEEAKEISQRKHKNLSFRFLLIVALVSITMGSFFIACSSDDMFSKETANEDTEVQKILGEHLTVENNRYVLNLSEEEAMTLGITQSDYSKFLSEIAELNTFVESTEKNETNISVILNDQDNQNFNYNPIRLKSGSEITGMIGPINLSSSDHNHVRSYPIYVPNGIFRIGFTFTTSATSNIQVDYEIDNGGNRPLYFNNGNPASIYVNNRTGGETFYLYLTLKTGNCSCTVTPSYYSYIN
jgi:hypothetical protein